MDSINYDKLPADLAQALRDVTDPALRQRLFDAIEAHVEAQEQAIYDWR